MNPDGCIFYTFNLTTHDPIEYVYVKLQFPNQIENYKVDLPQEAETSRMGRMGMQVWETGRNAKGECAVIQAAVNNNADVQASAAGHMIAVHASKLPPKTIILRMVATDQNKSNVKPNPKMYTEGSYEYIKLGQTVRKPLSVSDKGVTETK